MVATACCKVTRPSTSRHDASSAEPECNYARSPPLREGTNLCMSAAVRMGPADRMGPASSSRRMMLSGSPALACLRPARFFRLDACDSRPLASARSEGWEGAGGGGALGSDGGPGIPAKPGGSSPSESEAEPASPAACSAWAAACRSASVSFTTCRHHNRSFSQRKGWPTKASLNSHPLLPR